VLGAQGGCEGEGGSLTICDAEGLGRVWITGYDRSGDVFIAGDEDDRVSQLDYDGLTSGV
jgi:hypothetical protein